jgi:hypothetical protein
MKRIFLNAGRRAAATLAIAIVASASAAAQDYTVRMSSDDGTATTYVARNAIRKIEPTFNREVIYLLAEGRIIHVDNNKKTYFVLSLSQAREANTQVEAKMSAQQKELMHRMGLDAPPTITRLGAGETIAGYATEKFLIKTSMMETQVWAAPALAVAPAYYEIFASGAGQGGPFGGMSPFSDAGKTIRGMILKQVVTSTNNKLILTRVATSVDKTPIPASTFEPPAGYKLVEMVFPTR